MREVMASHEGAFLAKAIMPHGWGWAWVTGMTLFWLVILVALVYFASKLGLLRR